MQSTEDLRGKVLVLMQSMGKDEEVAARVMEVIERFDGPGVFAEEKTRRTYEDWVCGTPKNKGKAVQVLENLRFVGVTLEEFLVDRENMAWLRNIARKIVNGRSVEDVREDLMSDVLLKFYKTGHIEKYNPLKSNFSHHLYHAVRTTWLSMRDRESRNVMSRSLSLDYIVGDESDSRGWQVSNVESQINGSPVKAMEGQLPEAGMILAERIREFKDLLDTEIEPIEQMIVEGGKRQKFYTYMSEIWEWYWDELKTLEEIRVLAKVQASTMRRYFERIRAMFMAEFGIDLPMRLWSTKQEMEKYGVRENSDASRDTFLKRQLQVQKGKNKERSQRQVDKLKAKWENLLRLWKQRAERKSEERESVESSMDEDDRVEKHESETQGVLS